MLAVWFTAEIHFLLSESDIFSIINICHNDSDNQIHLFIYSTIRRLIFLLETKDTFIVTVWLINAIFLQKASLSKKIIYIKRMMGCVHQTH